MNHYTLLGCGDNVISMIFEIISDQNSDQIFVDIVKNIEIDGTRHPYGTDKIVASEIDASNWKNNQDTKFLFGVANPVYKRTVYEYFSRQFSISDEDFATVIHSNAAVASTARINKGVIINPGVVISPYTKVERFVFINKNVSLGHHITIGEFTQINPGVNIGGHCSIGKNAVIGIGANIIDHTRVGDNSIIGAGSMVNKDIPANVVAYGTPARVIREIK